MRVWRTCWRAIAPLYLGVKSTWVLRGSLTLAQEQLGLMTHLECLTYESCPVIFVTPKVLQTGYL